MAIGLVCRLRVTIGEELTKREAKCRIGVEFWHRSCRRIFHAPDPLARHPGLPLSRLLDVFDVLLGVPELCQCGRARCPSGFVSAVLRIVFLLCILVLVLVLVFVGLSLWIVWWRIVGEREWIIHLHFPVLRQGRGRRACRYWRWRLHETWGRPTTCESFLILCELWVRGRIQ